MSERSQSTASSQPTWHLVLAAIAAFGTYFCMYAFRKPFTAATFAGQSFAGVDLKTVLVISQLVGYMLSKFIGIKVVSEMPAARRAAGILILIAIAEAALLGFAWGPTWFRVVMMFFNGLPLGMVFGLVLAYLEGRRQTEALSAVLCASFILSSGVVKSVGQYLMRDWGVTEFQMPMVTGFIFLVPLVLAVWLLKATPPPDSHDLQLRSERKAMSRHERQLFLKTYWPGLAALVLVYLAVTVIRTIRDDFAVEIWRDLGVAQTPEIFTTSETVVAIVVTALSALSIWVRHNWAAIRVTFALMGAALGLCAFAVVLQAEAWLSPLAFMVACGIGLYVPYVAFHTTVFERLIPLLQRPSNLGFLMYVADAIGYLGYAVVILLKTGLDEPGSILPFFRTCLLVVAGLSIVALLGSLWYFHCVLARERIQNSG